MDCLKKGAEEDSDHNNEIIKMQVTIVSPPLINYGEKLIANKNYLKFLLINEI